MTKPRLVLALLVAVLIGTGPSAGAATWSEDDAARDVRLLDADATDPATIWVRDEADTETDVRRLVVTHAPRTVRVAFHLRDLRQRAGIAQIDLRTPSGEVTVYAVRTLRSELQFAERPGADGPERVQCDPGHRVDAAWEQRRDRIRVEIPRSCLGAPAWIRVHASFASLSHGFRDDSDVWIDDAGRRTASLGRPVYGPRIARG
jgi:hypothetical protein